MKSCHLQIRFCAEHSRFSPSPIAEGGGNEGNSSCPRERTAVSRPVPDPPAVGLRAPFPPGPGTPPVPGRWPRPLRPATWPPRPAPRIPDIVAGPAPVPETTPLPPVPAPAPRLKEPSSRPLPLAFPSQACPLTARPRRRLARSRRGEAAAAGQRASARRRHGAGSRGVRGSPELFPEGLPVSAGPGGAAAVELRGEQRPEQGRGAGSAGRAGEEPARRQVRARRRGRAEGGAAAGLPSGAAPRADSWRARGGEGRRGAAEGSGAARPSRARPGSAREGLEQVQAARGASS